MTEKKTIKPAPDWELIERHFRAGILTLRQIATEGGVVESAIRKRSKRDGWSRNLNAKIQHRADELVRKTLVRKIGAQANAPSEKEIVEVTAQAVATIQIVQKGSIQRGHALFTKLLDELEQTTNNKELFEQLGEMLNESSDDGRSDKLNELYRKVISLPMRVDSAKKMIEVLEKVVRLEREAFGIGAGDGKENPIDTALMQIAEMKRNGFRPA